VNQLTVCLEQLDSRAAIADLVYLYATGVRTGDADGCGRLFTADAVFEIREALAGMDASRVRFRLEGRDAIVDYLRQGSQTRVCPLIHNLIVVPGQTEARASSVMTTLVWPHGHQIVGEYQDSFRREDGWRFASRTFTIIAQFGAARG
jgi:hypothetical protein